MPLHLTFILSALEDTIAIMKASLAEILAVLAKGHAALPTHHHHSSSHLGLAAAASFTTTFHAQDPLPAQLNMQGLPLLPALTASTYDLPPDQLFNSNWSHLAQSHNGHKAQILALCCGNSHYLKGCVYTKKEFVVTGREQDEPLQVQVFVQGTTVNLICLVCVLCRVKPSATNIPLFRIWQQKG